MGRIVLSMLVSDEDTENAIRIIREMDPKEFE